MSDSELDAITTEVLQGFQGIADVTSPPIPVRYENGEYIRLYVRPRSSLGSALLTNRELLVLATSYNNLQARTIKMVESALQAAKGRLEPGLAVVFHADYMGDSKLREWGREQGLTILAVSTTSGVPQGQDLQDALCSGLYTHDPFDLAGPVRAAHQFFGRPDIPDIARRLRAGHIQAIFGIRKIGKTSVLNRIIEEARAYHGMACTMGDCSDDSISGLGAGQLLHSIAAGVNDSLNYEERHYTNLLPILEDISPSEAGRVLLDVLSRAERPVLIALDEVDYITPNSPVAPAWRSEFNPFFRALRAVYQECARRQLAFSVILCGVSSRWFTTEDVDGVENAALAFVPETYLPPFERSQSVAMIQTLGRAAGLNFGTQAAVALAETCSDMPFWMRKAGSFLNSCYPYDDRPLDVDYDDVVRLCQEFLEVEGSQLAYSSLRHLFRIYPELGPIAINSIDVSRTFRPPQDLVSALGRYGILGDGRNPSGPMVHAGLEAWRSQQANEQPMLDLQDDELATPEPKVAAGSASAAGEEEWAELLTEVSHRRNVLERQLRDIVATALRLEAAKRDDGKKALDLLLAALPFQRRNELTGMNMGNVLKALYWIELVGVIKKYWPVFTTCFGDRRQLDLFADIVNDRPDAHAKEFDGSELALQRRALNWFDERITSSGLL